MSIARHTRQSVANHSALILTFIGQAVEQGCIVDKHALHLADLAYKKAARWIDVPTEAVRRDLRALLASIVETVDASDTRGDAILKAFAQALYDYSECYYTKANRRLYAIGRTLGRA